MAGMDVEALGRDKMRRGVGGGGGGGGEEDEMGMEMTSRRDAQRTYQDRAGRSRSRSRSAGRSRSPDRYRDRDRSQGRNSGRSRSRSRSAGGDRHRDRRHGRSRSRSPRNGRSPSRSPDRSGRYKRSRSRSGGRGDGDEGNRQRRQRQRRDSDSMPRDRDEHRSEGYARDRTDERGQRGGDGGGGDQRRSDDRPRPKESRGFRWKDKTASGEGARSAGRDTYGKNSETRHQERQEQRDRRSRADSEKDGEHLAKANHTRTKDVNERAPALPEGPLQGDARRDRIETTQTKQDDAPARTSTAHDDKFGTASKFGARALARDRERQHTAKGKVVTSKTPTEDPSAPPISKPTTTTYSTARSTIVPRAGADEAMIIVNVNDRLGTKAAIPCLPSDPIRLFKAQVAARIGRQPHEIMLKRQGERPFKDALTLLDYGVSNGVQLDLEIDTGGD